MKIFFLNKISIILFLMITFPILAVQGDASAKFDEANKLFKEKKYYAALEVYENLVREGYQGEELFFNLGYTCSKTGETGKSILYLEKALIYNKNNPRVNSLLVNQHLKIKEKIVKLPDFFIFKMFKDVASTMTIWFWLFVFLFAYISGLVFLSGFLLKRQIANKKNLFIGLPIVFVLLLFSIPSVIINYDLAANLQECVVISENVNLYSVPEKEGKKEGTISEGNKLGIIETLSQWYRVKLPNGKEGWILKTGVEAI